MASSRQHQHSPEGKRTPGTPLGGAPPRCRLNHPRLPVTTRVWGVSPAHTQAWRLHLPQWTSGLVVACARCGGGEVGRRVRAQRRPLLQEGTRSSDTHALPVRAITRCLRCARSDMHVQLQWLSQCNSKVRFEKFRRKHFSEHFSERCVYDRQRQPTPCCRWRYKTLLFPVKSV